MKKVAYFRTADGFIGVTDESPKGMKNVVFAGRGPLSGKGIESVCDQAYATTQLEKLERVESSAVPDEWLCAIGLAQRTKSPPEPIPEPLALPITIELPGDRLRARILAKPGTPGYNRRNKEALKTLVMFALSFAIAWYLIVYLLRW